MPASGWSICTRSMRTSRSCAPPPTASCSIRIPRPTSWHARPLNAAASRRRALSEHDANLNPVVEMLESAEAQASEAVRELRQYASRVDLDPEALREAEARIEALHAAARRQRVRPDELPARFAELEKRLHELELAADPQAIEREVAAARARYDAAAKKLSARRSAGAQALSRAVTAAMAQLAMQAARFSVSLHKLDEPGAAGMEQVEFEVASHPSLPLRPLAKVASGGELSRISLAIQLVAAKASPVATLGFDGVDARIGGAVAETIGRSLKRLGRQRQVLCVTHLPQVAASGDAQWSVTKSASLKVRVQRLDRVARIEELALVKPEPRLAGLEMLAREEPRLLELREHPIDRGEADVDAFGDQRLVDVFGGKMADFARLEELEDLAARQRRLEAALLQA